MRGNGCDCHGHGHGGDEFGELWRLFTLPFRLVWKVIKMGFICLVWFLIALVVVSYVGHKSKADTAPAPAEQLICK